MQAVILLIALLAVPALAHDPNADAQYIKAVKGGGQYHYRGGDNFNRFYNNTQGSYGVTFNRTGAGAYSANQRVGICIIEVPTATLARDPKHVPAGNGSRADLSRIETCCEGYIRNIHNFRLCDPVCTTECVNALCTAPNTCTCFPDHVKNNAGFCVATCPIGCQNGHCAGGECLCKEGFKLDHNGRFCEPHCRENCGGVGNCTAPNTCTCKPGFHSTPEGSCKQGVGPVPQHGQCGSCINGNCAGTVCVCPTGYLFYRGECFAECSPACGLNEKCVAPNVCARSQPNNTSPFPHQVTVHNHPYPNQPQNNSQYPSQYPGQYPNGQYPHPNNPQNQNTTNGQYPYGQNPYGQNPNNKPPSSVYAQYPGGPPNQYPQPNGQYPQPSGQYPQPTSNQGQYPQQPGQHLYPTLPQNQYPHPSQPNVTDGQTFHQTLYNPLENRTFNMHQGQDHQGSQGSQGQYGTQGQFSQGQHGSQGQFNQGQQGSQGQYSSGQYGSNGQNSQGQFESQGQFSQGQHESQGQYGHGEYSSQGQYNQGQYGSQGQFSQGQYGSQGQNNQGQYGSQGQYGQVEVYGRPGQFVPQGQDQTLNWSQGQCAQPCVNATCVGVNRCECFPGYTQDPTDATGTKCQPYCHGGCHNGFCTAPNTCACDAGYHKDFSVKGRSVCVRRDKRSVEEKPVNVAELLVFEIPDY